MDELNLDEPDDDYWYAFGRIAEQYGERDVAIADYRSLREAEGRDDDSDVKLPVGAEPAEGNGRGGKCTRQVGRADEDCAVQMKNAGRVKALPAFRFWLMARSQSAGQTAFCAAR